MMRLFFLCIMMFLGTVPTLAIGVDDERLDDPVKEAAARELMKDIRCLVCQNQSIEDSNADLAKDLRRIVRQKTDAGQTPEQIRTFLVDRYGDWVMLKPPVEPRTYILWASPFVLALIFAGIVIGRRRSAPVVNALNTEEEARLKALLEDES